MHAIEALYRALTHTSTDLEGEVMDACLDSAVNWHVAYPVDGLASAEAVVDGWLRPLARSLPDMERRPYIEIPGEYRGQRWLAGTGYFTGTFTEPLWGIPATGLTLHLRYTELVRFNRDQRVTECYLLVDFLDAMQQAGVYPLRAALGHPGLILPPATLDGRCIPADDPDPAYSRGTEQLVMDMLDGLRRYDGASLESMDLEKYWHPDFLWFGPGGIGTTRGIGGFRAQHQGPFLRAFPDRDVDDHACVVARGDYVATGGWPHMHGTHSGDGWLGLPATGRRLELRVIDIWRRQGELLQENWVAIDIPHMLAQMGLDVFEQMKAITTAGNVTWVNSVS